MKLLEKKLILEEYDEYELRDQVEELGLDELSTLIDEYSSCATQGECNKVANEAIHIMSGNRQKLGRELYRELLHYFEFQTESIEEGKEDELPPVEPDEPIVVSTEPELSDVEQEVKDNALTMMINDAIKGEWDDVNNFKSMIATIASENHELSEEVIAILNEVIDNESITIGMLNKAMELVDSSSKELMKQGEEKAEEVLAGTESPVDEALETKEPIDDVKEDTITAIDVIKNHLDLHGDEDHNVVVCLKGELDDKDKSCLTIDNLSDEEYNALEKEFHEEDDDEEVIIEPSNEEDKETK